MPRPVPSQLAHSWRLCALSCAAASVMAPAAALAHAGDHAHTGIRHALTQPDHLVPLALAGAVAAALWAWARG